MPSCILSKTNTYIHSLPSYYENAEQINQFESSGSYGKEKYNISLETTRNAEFDNMASF